MYNLLNLDPLEFERFSLDFIEKKLNKKFKRFGPGKDDGIDLISLDEKIICQCKRYKDSTKLRTVCQKEYEKIKSKNFQEYYLITTAELNKTITDDIFKIFNKWMTDYSNIIGANDIEDFLEDEENIEVLKKNHKLWLTSSKVLNLYLNRYVDAVGKIIVDDISDISKYFVDTKPYYDAIKIIDEKNILLITGEPGIGKTLTSKMLIRYLLISNKEYKLRTVTNGNISQLIESMHQGDTPEIIFLDDFLGQTCLWIDDKLINDLKIVLKLAKMYKNKKVILNSRITILNKAKYEKLEFDKLLNEIGIQECLIDVNEITKIDRARILYNLMYHNKITNDYYEEIKKDKRYNEIIEHKSFNTRIIESCIRNSYKINCNDFYEYMISSLNNPKDVWKSEFDRIDLYDVILMYQLFTLGNNYIPIDVLKKATLNSLYNRGYSTEKYDFNDSINRLSKSLIGITIIKRKRYVSVLNPSINDYIQNYLVENYVELKKLFDESLYIEQIAKICNLVPSILKDNIPQFNSLLAYNSYNSYMSENNICIKKKIDFILKFKYFDKKIIEEIWQYYDIKIGGDYLIRMALNKSIRRFYQLDTIINDVNKMSKILFGSDYDYVNELFEYYACNDFSINLVEDVMNALYIDSLETKLIQYGEDYANDYINSSEHKDKFNNEDGTFSTNDEYIFELKMQLETELELVTDSLIADVRKFGYNFEKIDIDYNIVIENICIEMMLEDDLNSFLAELSSDSIERDYSFLEFETPITVDDIFNQDYNVSY